ncbi:MAG: hypothetical protein DHS20C04_21410 [Hyphococcus sp.]|nr:MAG: hypothetical protein DHS20C04_21410 [Marinicaulis sp.]
MRERSEAKIASGAEGATAPETLRQKDRFAALKAGKRAAHFERRSTDGVSGTPVP